MSILHQLQDLWFTVSVDIDCWFLRVLLSLQQPKKHKAPYLKGIQIEAVYALRLMLLDVKK